MFYIPTLQALANRARQAFSAYLPGVDAWIPANNIAPTAKVIAGSLYELFERLSWVFQQAFTLYAEGTWLDKHGEEYGMPRMPNAPATGLVQIVSTDAIDVPDGTWFTLGNSVYQSQADASLSGAGTLFVSVLALVAGSAANAIPGAPLTISNGVGAGLTGPGASEATAIIGPDGITGGLDVETDDDYRARILFRMRNPPSGGTAADYVIWSQGGAGSPGVAGVTRVFVERLWRGGGTVRVFPIFDNLFAAQGGIAPQSYIDAVAAALAPVQPAVAIVTVAAPEAFPIDVTITGLTPDNQTTRNAVTAELQDTFTRLGRVSGSDKNLPNMPYLAWPFTFSGIWLQAAVANAAGVTSADVAPTSDQVIPEGALPVLGQVSFVSAP